MDHTDYLLCTRPLLGMFMLGVVASAGLCLSLRLPSIVVLYTTFVPQCEVYEHPYIHSYKYASKTNMYFG